MFRSSRKIEQKGLSHHNLARATQEQPENRYNLGDEHLKQGDRV